MKELKVGERVVLDIVETETMTCEGCFFDSKDVCEVEKISMHKEISLRP